jgi:predicted glycoside hydrolase/deacetylase ChbG (UPF0249 family)
MNDENRYLIVNADDLGQSFGINEGIFEAHAHGIVTSASLMVRWPAAEEAAEWASREPSVSLGLHLDLGEWICEGEEWVASYEVVHLGNAQAVDAEARRQLETFRNLAGRHPTHLDSHQHVHSSGHAAVVAEELAAELGVPLRGRSSVVRHCGSFYGRTGDGRTVPDALSVENLTEILTRLPPGITEVACHPGHDDMRHPYGLERAREVDVLCDPRLPGVLAGHGLMLCSFYDVKHGTSGIPQLPNEA